LLASWGNAEESDARYFFDDATGGELLLGGMIAEVQNTWGASSEEYEGLEALAQGAIRKETKLATVRL